MPGQFIVIEGIDGSGKTTFADKLGQLLGKHGLSVGLEKEPSNTSIGNLVRELVGESHIDDATKALLFAADRVEHSKKIRQLLTVHDVVLCDRYIHSSYVYQREGCPAEWMTRINRNAIRPRATFWLDTSPEVCFQRISSRGSAAWDPKSITDLRVLRDRYLLFLQSTELFIQAYEMDLEAVANQIVKWHQESK